MRIGIDIDGVLYPWDECARDALVGKFGIERPGPSTEWEYVKKNLERAHWDWLWTAEGQDVVFGCVDRTYADAVDAVNRILRAGHEVHFVTHRDPRRTALHTAAFLTLHFGGHPWAGVHVIQRGMAKHKLAEWDVFVDDKAETVWDFLYKAGSAFLGPRVFAPVRPWNEELSEHTYHARLTRYTDPAEVAEWVLAQ